ncbi:MerR family transcriptional regulator [Oricola sp.]|uniref:MerR family transcriptional regulator n=1 Tax=Oricola sp. TaxID=1979950 RepID=UPI003BA845A6
MQIGEVSERSGLSADTLRYYEKIGLIDPPYRKGGRRYYDADVLAWLSFLRALKATGMPLSNMMEYARQRRLGSATTASRREMLEQQRNRVREQISELNACLELLDRKISNYRQIESDLQQPAGAGMGEFA